jgi:hypothetical protein
MSDRYKPNYEQIQRRAYELFLERGAEPGRDSEDWFAAEQEFSNLVPRDVPPKLEALPQQDVYKSSDAPRNIEAPTEETIPKKKYASSGRTSN